MYRELKNKSGLWLKLNNIALESFVLFQELPFGKKNFGGKKIWRKGYYKGLAKTLVNVDLHCQSSINRKTKLNEG